MKMGYQAVLYWHFHERKEGGKVKLKNLTQTGLHQPVCVGLAALQRLELTTIKGPLKRWRASVDHPSPRQHNMKVKQLIL